MLQILFKIVNQKFKFMKKNYILLRRLLLLVIVGICTTFAQAQTSISDAAGLAAIANDLSGSYVLTSDITLTGTWTPIGTFTIKTNFK